MSSHSNRSDYRVCREGILKDPNLASSEGTDSRRRLTEPQFKFGRMFQDEDKAKARDTKFDENLDKEIVAELLALATTINANKDAAEAIPIFPPATLTLASSLLTKSLSTRRKNHWTVMARNLDSVPRRLTSIVYTGGDRRIGAFTRTARG
jgi:hypothetical protein